MAGCFKTLSLLNFVKVRLKSTGYKLGNPSNYVTGVTRPYVTTHQNLKLNFPNALYGGRQTVSMLAGDGIGQELMVYVKEVFKTANVPIDFETITLDKNHCSEEDYHKAILSIKRNGIAIKGSVLSNFIDPQFSGSLNARMRVELDLYVSLMHCRSFEGTRCRFSNLDIVIVRQNTEGEYTMIEHESVPGVVECMKVITRAASEKLARFAFNYAVEHNRKKVTCVHKANIQKMSDGLFLESVSKVAKEYPQIKFNNMIVDNTAMQLVSKPEQFDVIIAPNLYGLIAQNIISGLSGGPGLFSGINYGDNYVIFEPGIRSVGRLLKQNTANPVAMLVASIEMLRYLHLHSYADIINDAVVTTITEDRIHTEDLGGTATSLDVMQNIVERVKHARQKSGVR